MSARRNRLKKLVEVQEQLKALHEARAPASWPRRRPRGGAAGLARRFDEDDSLSALFPSSTTAATPATGAARRSLENARREAEWWPPRARAPTWSSAPSRRQPHDERAAPTASG